MREHPVGEHLHGQVAERGAFHGTGVHGNAAYFGGCRDGHLNRRTAEVCGLPVYAGPVEGTALGNLAVQMLADGAFPNLRAVRAAIAESFDVQKVEP